MNITHKHRTAKARFWRTLATKPFVSDPKSLPLGEICKYSGSQSVRTWIKDDEWADWFFNEDSAKQLIEAGIEVAVQSLIDICTADRDKTLTGAAQVNAAKALLEFGGYAPPKTKVVEYADKSIANLSEEELTEYIAKKTKLGVVNGD